MESMDRVWLGRLRRGITPRALLCAAVLWGTGEAAGAAEEMTSLQVAFLQGEYESVLRQASVLEQQGSTEPDTVLYLQGASALKLRAWEMARSSLQRLIAKYPRSQWRRYAWLGIGDSLEGSRQDEEALRVYQGLTDEEEAREWVAQVMLRIGKIQMRLGRWEESRAALQAVVAQAPRGEEAAAASQLLQKGDFYFCVQVGAFRTRANAVRLA